MDEYRRGACSFSISPARADFQRTFADSVTSRSTVSGDDAVARYGKTSSQPCSWRKNFIKADVSMTVTIRPHEMCSGTGRHCRVFFEAFRDGGEYIILFFVIEPFLNKIPDLLVPVDEPVELLHFVPCFFRDTYTDDLIHALQFG
jgi:hypothetical protein